MVHIIKLKSSTLVYKKLEPFELMLDDFLRQMPPNNISITATSLTLVKSRKISQLVI